MMTDASPVTKISGEFCEDWLNVKLTLSINGKDYKIPGGNIKNIEINCQYYGFAGEVRFSVPEDADREDKLLNPFCTENLIEIDLNIVPVLPPVEKLPDPLKIKGLVTKKSLQEELYERQTKDIEVYYRHYQVSFADPAQVLWQQHFPCELYVKDTMESVFRKQLTEQIKLECKLPAMKTKHPMICLGLGLDDQYNNGFRHDNNKASFYDFVLDYVKSHHAHFQYDYKRQSYLIIGERAKPEKSKDFTSDEVLSLTTHWKSTRRHQIQLLNALADKPKKNSVINKQAVEGVRQDILLRDSVTSKVDAFKAKATALLKPNYELQELYFSRWPIVTFAPGYAFSVDKKTWGKDPFYLDKKYRVVQMQIKADIEDERQEYRIQDHSAGYKLRYQVWAESESSEHPQLPKSIPAAYPIQVEGIVVSTVGDESKKDKTHDLEKHRDTKKNQYKVKIPLWDQIILIEAEPDYMHPRLYLPYDRNDKLLIDLFLYKGRVARVLDWGARTKLPQKTQGNHLLFGKNDKDETSMRHLYEGEKPVLHIKRQKEEDNEQIKFKEGTLILETNWEEK